MSAAAVIIIRIKRVFSFLRDRHATSPDSAIFESEVPYSQKWYYKRLIDYGAIKRIGSKCYLDDVLAQSYIRDWRKRGIVFIVVVVSLTCFYFIVRMLFK